MQSGTRAGGFSETLQNPSSVESLTPSLPPESSAPSWLMGLVQRKDALSLTFAGQGFLDLDAIAALSAESEGARRLVEVAERELQRWQQEPEARWGGKWEQGASLQMWLQKPETRPNAAYFMSSEVSQSLIFLSQMVTYQYCYERGLHRLWEQGQIKAASGHSQGIMPALLVAESPGGQVDPERFATYLRYFLWQAVSMIRSWEQTLQSSSKGDNAPMAAISGLTSQQLQKTIDKLSAFLPPSDSLTISLFNTRLRHVVSGSPAALRVLRNSLEMQAEKEQKRKKAGRFAGKPLELSWEDLAVEAAYHSPYMAPGRDMMLETLAGDRLDFALTHEDLHIEVLSPATAKPYDQSEPLLEQLVTDQFVGAVRWSQVVSEMAQQEPVALLDFGPGDGVARLSRSNLKGTGVDIVALATTSGRDALFVHSDMEHKTPLNYRDFLPTLRRDSEGQLHVENLYTRATGQPPVVLPGMTPTTVEVPLVAAAANAGFTAELAGGGQVTEEIFWKRMEELQETLQPGAEVIFNALYLDPYLWNLHIRQRGLIQQARKAGVPICGLTISAGVPEVDEAVALLDSLAELDIWMNAFKPGTVAQVKQVVKIAQKAPHHTILVHLEGGKAGGHHSWENLNDLLLDCYFLIRQQPNLVLCVGGGIGDEERAVELLTGRWSKQYGLPAMPVDSVLLGTVTMACLEAATSPQVKQALVDAAGTEDWVFHGQLQGGMTSGKSQLNADIHYLENAAARCGRILDDVAGDEEAIFARRDEIIEALNATAKPYFGELEEMTYAAVAERMIALMAVGRHDRYEDGIWPDRSFRVRLFDFLRNAEARLCAQEEGSFEPVLQSLDVLDSPQDGLASWLKAYPEAATTLLHPLDARHFVHKICARPGKPVNFVPVIDANVRRWYKSDSLWQAHHDGYEAEQVLILPGPEAVRGLRQVDEPVADLLGRFNKALKAELSEQNKASARRGWSHLPEGFLYDASSQETSIFVENPENSDAWNAIFAGRRDDISHLFQARRFYSEQQSLPNPLLTLCKASEGNLWRLYHNVEEGLHKVEFHLHEGSDAERVVVTHEAEGLQIAVHIPQMPGQTVSAPYTLQVTPELRNGEPVFVMTRAGSIDSIRSFYHYALFGTLLESVELFDTAEENATIPSAQIQGYGRVTGGEAGLELPVNMAFSVVWRALFRTLSCDEVTENLFQLVHLNNQVETHAGWPVYGEEELTIRARITRLEDSENGRRVVTVSEILRGEQACATVHSSFFIRGQYGRSETPVQAREEWKQSVLLSDEGSLRFVKSLDWLQWEVEAAVGDRLEWELELSEERPRHGLSLFAAIGTLRRGGLPVAHVQMEHRGTEAVHPVRHTLSLLDAAQTPFVSVERKTLARRRIQTPQCMDTFSEVSFDANPIHRSTLIARLSGLDAPLVQGMWTAAHLSHFVQSEVARGQHRRLKRFETDFLNPVYLNETLELEALRVGVRDGVMLVEATATALRGDERLPIVRAQAEIAAPRTAYVFPGQGIQQKGMGMDGFSRSRAAREIWEFADNFTRRELGFSVLHIVRQNPRELNVGGELLVHPKGVLHLTQFTQVAMAVLAQAQIAEMRECGVLDPQSIICGHSVGEYNAIAVTGILPLEAVVSIVYQRGQVMHSLVERDENGVSNYRMAVIRPHYARMDHGDAEELVRQIREDEGIFLEIVNYNVKGRQYSVTGEIAGLELLKQRLQEKETGSKPAYIEIPGIDVPFHSSRLVAGVPNFRASLQKHLPATIDVERLLGKYIPNLVPRPFSLGLEYVKEVAEYTKSQVLLDALEGFERWEDDANGLARILLIELLAWQFASPVRWIETQDLLFYPEVAGGMAMEQIIEIGVGYQPTLANMARYTHRLMGPFAPQVDILNAEAEADTVLMQDSDPEEVVVEEAPAPAETAAPAATAPVAVAAPVVAAPVAAGPVEDRSMTVEQALKILLSVQAKVQPEQIRGDETLDDLFGGVSSRRNQVLLDLGAEFNLGPIDGAHEKPLTELYADVTRRAGNYRFPGKYLKGVLDDTLKRVFGRAGLSRKDIEAHLKQQFGLGDGLTAATLGQLVLETREGQSGRGGALGGLGEALPSKRAEGLEVADKAVALLGSSWGIALHKQSAGGGGGGAAVDAAVVNELRDEVLGAEGVLMQSARNLAKQMGHSLEAEQAGVDHSEDLSRLEMMESEHGADYDTWLAPRFEQEKHVAFTSSWAWVKRDVSAFFFAASQQPSKAQTLLAGYPSLLLHQNEASVQAAARWYAVQAEQAGLSEASALLNALSEGRAALPTTVNTSRPSLELRDNGQWEYNEVEDVQGAEGWLSSLSNDTTHSRLLMGEGGQWNEAFYSIAEKGLSQPMAFVGETALITGASPGSIAVECVRHLLRGGARVIVTTTSYNPKRLRFYRELYQQEAAPGSELHIVPFNQASYQDVDALVHWIFASVEEQDGASVRVLKRPFAPTLVLPFAAIKEQGTLNEHSGRSDAAMRAMLTSVERLITGIANRYQQQGLPPLPCHVVLPLSPNHGAFGGDGVYAETKAALEVLLHKWRSEAEAWAEAVTFCAARIGWVRGTGLMDANNPLAARLEDEHGIRTFASSEMGYLLSVLCTEEARREAVKAPLKADLTGGMAAIPNLKQAVDTIRQDLDTQSRAGRRFHTLQQEQMQTAETTDALAALPCWPASLTRQAAKAPTWPTPERALDLSRTIVIVGAGEVSPVGSSRTRFSLEISEELSAAAVLELAWMTGKIRFDQSDRGGQWVDVETEEPVAEAEIAERYRQEVRDCVGIRFMEPELTSFDPEQVSVMTSVFLEEEFSFEVGSEEEAQSFVMAAPDKTRARYNVDNDSWTVTCLQGREVRVPRKIRLNRQVAGLVPSGFDFQRYGFPQEMIERIDRITLFNLLATVDAFLSAGLTPEELLQWLHPARVANTQGAGIGGMQSLHRLYVDPVLDDTRQNDTLQETLINVVAAYAVQSYVGSYGVMSHPVAACATAAVSLEEGFDKLLLDKADFVVTGGYDDIGLEGSIGFSDMNATADTDKMQKMGLEPHQMSRSNDARRRGFVEAQGGGTLLLTRAELALEKGLPILGVVGFATSYGDGIHKSIPAPGLGAMAAAMGGTQSPLARALNRFGLTTDDIAVVSKHDTSTAANDPNENRLHNTIQQALGRTEGNPLFVVSQKTLTGHPKGGAAAWQLIGLCQSLQEGLVPGNRNLDSVDGQMEEFGHLTFSDRTLSTGVGLRAGLVTSLGFGHVSALALVMHPEAVLSQLSDEARTAYEAKSAERTRLRDVELTHSMMELKPFFEARTHRRFDAADGTPCQLREESAMLLDADSRLDAAGRFATGAAKQ